jgi:hypothetical protein
MELRNLKMKHRYILQTSQNGVTAEMIFVGGAAFMPSQLMKRVYLPPDVIPDGGACDCSCWALLRGSFRLLDFSRCNLSKPRTTTGLKYLKNNKK